MAGLPGRYVGQRQDSSEPGDREPHETSLGVVIDRAFGDLSGDECFSIAGRTRVAVDLNQRRQPADLSDSPNERKAFVQHPSLSDHSIILSELNTPTIVAGGSLPVRTVRAKSASSATPLRAPRYAFARRRQYAP